MAARRSRARKPIINKDEYTGVLKDMIIRTGEINPEGGSLYLSPAALKLARKAQAAKFPFLWHFFNIDPKSEDRWELLAKALAERCVPGMRARYIVASGDGSYVRPMQGAESPGEQAPCIGQAQVFNAWCELQM